MRGMKMTVYQAIRCKQCGRWSMSTAKTANGRKCQYCGSTKVRVVFKDTTSQRITKIIQEKNKETFG